MLDRERLSAITDNVVYDEPMSKHTTFRIGGTADAFVSPENALEIEKIIHFCKDTDTPYMLMGNGSNMLVGEGYFAGKLIQDAGLMGYSVGGAMVSDKHAGFVVNKGGATAKDVLDLIKYVQDTVEEKFGVKLEPEVRLIGEQ